jgi:hypothetical protein
MVQYLAANETGQTAGARFDPLLQLRASIPEISKCRQLIVVTSDRSRGRSIPEGYRGNDVNFLFLAVTSMMPFMKSRNSRRCWVSILGRQALQGASFVDVKQLREAIITSSPHTMNKPLPSNGTKLKSNNSPCAIISLTFAGNY